MVMSEISTKRNLTFVVFSDAKVDKPKATLLPNKINPRVSLVVIEL